jgi:type IV pilus assembly protein PilA
MVNAQKNKKGFTLVELVVVIAILGILAAIAVPRLTGFTDEAKKSNDRELASIIAHSIQMEIAAETIVVGTAGTVLISVNNAATPTTLNYSFPSSGGAVLKDSTGTTLIGTDLKVLMNSLVGSTKTFSYYKETAGTSGAIITITDNGEVPVGLITFIN